MSIAVEKNETEKVVYPIKTLDILAKGYGWKKPGAKTYSPAENISNYYKMVGKVRLFIAIDQEQQKVMLIPLWKCGGSWYEPMPRLHMPTYEIERYLEKGDRAFLKFMTSY